LVQRVELDGGAGRYRMLETIREFAAERLAASGEEVTLRDRHALWALALAQSTRAHTSTLEQALAANRLAPEQPNIEAALRWLHEREQGATLVDLVNALEFYWEFTQLTAPALRWYQHALAYSTDLPSKRLDLLNSAGPLAHQVESPLADPYIAELAPLAEEIGTTLQRANAAYVTAMRAEDLGDYPRAETGFLGARALFEQAGDAWQAVMCDYHLGVVAYGQRQLGRAVEKLEGARAAAATINDPFTPAWCLVYLAFIACERGDVEGAMAHLRKHPDITRDASGQQERLDQEHEPLVRVAAGVVASALGKHRLATRLLGSAVHNVPLREPELRIAERCQETARRALGDAEFASLWDAGFRMRPAEVQADFDRVLSGPDAAPTGDVAVREASHGLSPREVEVVRLLADGLTNQEIAKALYVSPRTVNSHIDHILTKLDVRSRTAAVAFAIRNGLV
ncbi:MAG TPA: LuxR C-terminal-related transcriptional regulator, partial [Chloroflexota bacterium]|nr:LuxR C-terminal-related transcriptional regulator [Chloroflexota bacterium]